MSEKTKGTTAKDAEDPRKAPILPGKPASKGADVNGASATSVWRAKAEEDVRTAEGVGKSPPKGADGEAKAAAGVV